MDDSGFYSPTHLQNTSHQLSNLPSLDLDKEPQDHSIRLIQSLQSVQRDVTEIQKKTANLHHIDEQLRTLAKGQTYILRYLNKINQKKSKGNRKRSKLPTRLKEKTAKPMTPKGNVPQMDDLSTLLHLPAALQANMLKFLDNLLFEPTDLPDKLLDKGCLSEDECQTIISKPSPKDQIRSLILKLKNREPEKIFYFLELVKKENEVLVDGVYDTLKNIKEENRDNSCVFCLMVRLVDLRDIADNLYQEKIISDELYEALFEMENLHRFKEYHWEKIVHCINTNGTREAAKMTLFGALEQKYKHLTNHLKEIPEGSVLICTCGNRKSLKSSLWSTSSQTDISSSAEDNPPIPSHINKYSTSDEESRFNSSDYDILMFCGDKRQDFLANEPRFSASQENSLVEIAESGRSRHSSGPFAPKPSEANADENVCSSLPFVSEQLKTPSAEESNTPPDFYRGLSTISSHTLVAANGSSASELTDTSVNKSSADQSTSPDSDETKCPAFKIVQETGDFNRGIGSDHEALADDEGDGDRDMSAKKRKIFTQRRFWHKYEKNYDENEYDKTPVRKSSRQRRKILQRQKSAPAAFLLTKSRSVMDTTLGKISVRKIDSNKNKTNRKREERRKKAREKIDPSDADLDMNSAPPCEGGQMLEWNSARTLSLMSQLSRVSQPPDVLTMPPHLKSDTDFVTEESEAVAYSDYTV